MLRHRNTLRLPKRQAGHLFIGARRALLGGPKWTPLPLYTAGEQGVWYDPSDLTTLFADSAGTTPAVVGGPVGLMLDKSGRGNHASQPTAINRPVLQQDGAGLYYLAFNGTNSWVSTASIDFTATDKMTAIAGVRKLSDAGQLMLAGISSDPGTLNGTFSILAPRSSTMTTAYGLRSRGTVLSDNVATGPASAPHTAVLSGLMSISDDLSKFRVNGVEYVSGTDQGTGNYGNYPIYIGARAGTSLFFNGRLYNLIMRGALSSNSQIIAAERFVNAKTGAF